MIGDLGVVDDVVGQVGLATRGDVADLEGADRNGAVGAVEVGVHAGARRQCERRAARVSQPDASEGSVEVVDHGLSTRLENVDQRVSGHERAEHGPQQPVARRVAHRHTSDALIGATKGHGRSRSTWRATSKRSASS